MPARHASNESTKPGQAAAKEQLLGEIETRIVGMQYHEAGVEPGEQINLEREPENSHDKCSILVENGHFQSVGHLPRRKSSWLAPLIDAGEVRVEGCVPKSAKPSRTACPLTLTMFLCEKGQHLLEKATVSGKFDVLHEVVRQTYQDAQEYSDPELITELADGLGPLAKQELLPETRLLLALLPGLAQGRRITQAFEAMAICRSCWARSLLASRFTTTI